MTTCPRNAPVREGIPAQPLCLALGRPACRSRALPAQLCPLSPGAMTALTAHRLQVLTHCLLYLLV